MSSTIFSILRYATAFAVISAFGSMVNLRDGLAEELIFGIIPEAEWNGARISTGGVTPDGLRAIEVATSELRKHGRKVEDFRSIHVSETEVSYIVQFSDTELHSTINDDRSPPAGGRLAIFRIDNHTFEVLGAVY